MLWSLSSGELFCLAGWHPRLVLPAPTQLWRVLEICARDLASRWQIFTPPLVASFSGFDRLSLAFAGSDIQIGLRLRAYLAGWHFLNPGGRGGGGEVAVVTDIFVLWFGAGTGSRHPDAMIICIFPIVDEVSRALLTSTELETSCARSRAGQAEISGMSAFPVSMPYFFAFS